MRTRVDTFIAHFRKRDGEIQSLEDHLKETAYLCSCFALEIGLPLCGRLLGLLHDIGKYSSTFQKYIRDVTGLNGEAAVAEAKLLRGKVDHATAGGQIVWRAYKANQIPCFVAQILSVVLISHHSRSGMKDFIDLKGRSPFLERLYRDECSTHCDEALRQCNSSILGEINHLLGSKGLVDELRDAIERIKPVFEESIPRYNAFSMLCRYLFSCLLDADRINTSDFENPRAADFRSNNIRPDWRSYVEQLENRLSKFSSSSDIDQLRSRISSECRDASGQKKNLFTLQVPTGGGKTLASLRFALHRALSPETHRVDRIIYVLPYTSILDQNASVARRIFGDEEVLEHHSNLSEERDTLRNRVLSENWDAPIVFTTSVQFLNTLFAGGTKTARRMHQLSNAILVFDEIQALPVKTIHLFNNAINFLCSQGNTTVVLCTATMPLLHAVNSKLGALPPPDGASIISERAFVLKKLKRTTVVDDCRPGGWSNREIVELAQELQSKYRSLLIICNTKKSANQLYDLLKSDASSSIVHLSTNMCPAHRLHKIALIEDKLDPKNAEPIICVSTQLIEAGVDLDFGCVVRSLAGLDSIVQAAGRCNRHGYREMGYVHVLNFKEEKLYASLKDIELAQDITRNRIFQEYRNEPDLFDNDLLSEKAMDRFYEYYFY
ncbi:MAG: CRISPR-associated helicase Cas3', partial [Verrucomicrobiota bacterium]